MHPKEKKRRGREQVYGAVRRHVIGCTEVCHYTIQVEKLAKHLEIESRGVVRQALDRMVREGLLTKTRRIRWFGRTCYFVRKDRLEVA